MSKINTLSNKIILMFRKNIYVKNNLSPFKISRTKIDLYFDCKRCFYIDQKYGIKRPHGAALVINNHIVNKFKKNLEILRNTKTIIPETTLISESGFTALDHPRVSHWTDPFKGIESFHKTTNMTVNASIDDIWTDDEKCYPVIIKSISRESKDVENSIWPGYTRQLSLYGHLLQNNDLEIIGINYKDTKKNANDFLKDLGNPYDNIIFDNKGTNAIEWGAYGVPESFLINNNKIIKKYIGPLSKGSLQEIKLFIK